MKRLFAIAFMLMLCICAFAEEALPQSIGLTGVTNARELGGYIAEDGENEKADAAWQTDTALAIGYADKLFDNSFVHRIDVRLADADWTGLLADPISKTKDALHFHRAYGALAVHSVQNDSILQQVIRRDGPLYRSPGGCGQPDEGFRLSDGRGAVLYRPRRS